ncbi:MAG: MMPL family transporter, partial [Pararhodobacter sp.]|nr:MMPL family transporter [Pararhodobacter sp.]
MTVVTKFFCWLARRPVVVAPVLLALTLIAAAGATNLRTEIDFSGLINPQSQTAQAMRDYQARFGRMSFDEVLLIEGDRLDSDAALDALEELLIELQFVEGVERVFSIFSIPGPGMASAWLTSPQAQDLDAATRLQRLQQTNPLAAQMLSDDLSATVVVVVPQRGTPRAALLQGLARARADAAPALRLTAAGLPEVHAAIGTGLLRDLRILTPIAVLACALLTLLLFRSLQAVIVCALPPVCALFWFMGWLGARSITLDPLMGSLPVVLIVLCFSQCMHLYYAALRLSRQGEPPVDVVPRALAETLPAMALTTLTTVMAFVSIALQGAPQLTKMAHAGIVGMILGLVAGLTLAPLLMWLLRAPRPADREPGALGPVLTLARHLARRVRLVPAGTAVLMVALLLLQSESRIGFRYAEYLPTTAPITQTLQRMEAMGLGSDRIFLVVDSAPALAPARAEDGTAFAPELANLTAAAAILWGEGRRQADWLDALHALAESGRISAGDGSAHALPVQLPLTGGAVQSDTALRQIEAQMQAAGLGGVTQLVGANQALLTEGPALVEQLRFGLYATIAAITLLIGWVYRSWRIALVALVPNLVPILGVEAWMVMVGRELSIMTMIALTVAFGIAVDDTLHLLNRYRLAAGLPHIERVDRALADAGPPIIAT